MEKIPSEAEILDWLVQTTKHSMHVEYFLEKFDVNPVVDLERPHDTVGPYNKFEWPVIKGLALKDRSVENFFFHIEPSLKLHRKQLHHRMWNGEHYLATPENLTIGAVDAICSQLENRDYQGGKHTYDEINEILFKTNKQYPRKLIATIEAIAEMRKLTQPDLESITDLYNIHNIGINNKTYQKIIFRLNEALQNLYAENHLTNKYHPQLITT
ncbi:hypothetical protein JXM83_01870 [Candidatus Woesearchaeota archaeon]|nr:hypothetical protein [Candidatus Woesearchaeota archaeon]